MAKRIMTVSNWLRYHAYQGAATRAFMIELLRKYKPDLLKYVTNK